MNLKAIITADGTASGKTGDWVVTGPDRDRYFVPHKVFSETYEPVMEEHC